MRLFTTLAVLSLLAFPVFSTPVREAQALARADLNERSLYTTLLVKLFPTIKYILGNLGRTGARAFDPSEALATRQTPRSARLARSHSGPMGSEHIQSIAGRDKSHLQEMVEALDKLNKRDPVPEDVVKALGLFSRMLDNLD